MIASFFHLISRNLIKFKFSLSSSCFESTSLRSSGSVSRQEKKCGKSSKIPQCVWLTIRKVLIDCQDQQRTHQSNHFGRSHSEEMSLIEFFSHSSMPTTSCRCCCCCVFMLSTHSTSSTPFEISISNLISLFSQHFAPLVLTQQLSSCEAY